MDQLWIFDRDLIIFSSKPSRKHLSKMKKSLSRCAIQPNWASQILQDLILEFTFHWKSFHVPNFAPFPLQPQRSTIPP